MRGVITKRDIIENFGLIWREFGLRCLARCLSAVVSGRSTTFLELAVLEPTNRAAPRPQTTDFQRQA